MLPLEKLSLFCNTPDFIYGLIKYLQGLEDPLLDALERDGPQNGSRGLRILLIVDLTLFFKNRIYFLNCDRTNI